jgi:hypothetical protein
MCYRLNIKNASSAYSGKLTVKAVNEVGEDSAEFDVKVKGKKTDFL